jgi:hypothetical protein
MEEELKIGGGSQNLSGKSAQGLLRIVWLMNSSLSDCTLVKSLFNLRMKIDP